MRRPTVRSVRWRVHRRRQPLAPPDRGDRSGHPAEHRLGTPGKDRHDGPGGAADRRPARLAAGPSASTSVIPSSNMDTTPTAPAELAHGAVGGDGLGAMLTGFGVTITSRCSTSCLAQLRRDAAVPDDDSRRAGQSREPRRTRAASRPRGGCAGVPAGCRHRPAEPSEVDDRVRPARAAASPNASAAPASSRLSPRCSASARGSRPPRSRREAC
jgi:hypothetical protein